MTLREERRLRVLEDRVLRKKFRLKRKEATGEWRILHNEGLYDMYLLLTKCYSGDHLEKNEMSGACGMYGGEERCIQCFGGEI